jgi:predicted nucleotide-binding protein
MPGEFASQLEEIAANLGESAAMGDEAIAATTSLEQAANDIARAWSGSALGYQSRVYYVDFAQPPPGAHFSSEWGFMGTFQGTTGEWREYRYDDVMMLIRSRAGNPDTARLKKKSDDARKILEAAQGDITSILSAFSAERADEFLTTIKGNVEQTAALTEAQAVAAQMPIGVQLMSRDSAAIGQGLQAAAHQAVLAEVAALRSPFRACSDLAMLAHRAAAHIERLSISTASNSVPQGSNVFIGHGRSSAWRDLKEFVQDRLHLPWDEFNRVPVAGLTNIARLSQMLDDAGIAFLILTAEDELVDGAIIARQNVIHEAGLFQGRLGFMRAIVLLEDGCAEFSNIAGLGQIRFPQGNIAAKFENVRQVLEREGFLDA